MVVSSPLSKLKPEDLKCNPFIISVFSSIDFVSLVEWGRSASATFSVSSSFPSVLCTFGTTWVNFIPCEALCCLRLPSCLRWRQNHCLNHLFQTGLQKGAKLLMAPILYSRRQVEWEPASNLIEGVCLTLQRQPIISFLPHLRSLINVCVNLVSSQVAILWNFAKFNSAFDFSESKIYRSTTLCPTYPWKQTAQVTLKIVRCISRWYVGRPRDSSLHGVLLPTHYFDNSPLQVALRVEGCQLESGVAETTQLARSWCSLGWESLKCKEDFFFPVLMQNDTMSWPV